MPQANHHSILLQLLVENTIVKFCSLIPWTQPGIDRRVYKNRQCIDVDTSNFESRTENIFTVSPPGPVFFFTENLYFYLRIIRLDLNVP